MIYLNNQSYHFFYINEYLMISEIELNVSSIIEKSYHCVLPQLMSFGAP